MALFSFIGRTRCRQGGQRSWRYFIQLAMAVLLVSLTKHGPLAQAADAFHVDYSRLPTVIVDATNAPVEQVLKDLADRLDFEIAYAGSVDKSSTVNGRFQGEVADILPRILRGMDYVVVYDGAEIRRVVVTSSKATAQARTISTTTPSGAVAGQPGAPEVGGASTVRPAIANTAAGSIASSAAATSIANSAAAAPPSITPSSTLSASGGSISNPGLSAPTSPLDTLAGSAAGGNQPSQAEDNPVSSLLQSQANLLRPNIGAPPPDPGDGEGSDASQASPSAEDLQKSLAATTQKAQENLRSLIDALKAACIGNNCPK